MIQHILFEDYKVQKPVNVASVPMRSPFRYAGGKTWFIPYVRKWLKTKNPNKITLIEPFLGGAIVSLTTAFENLAKNVIMIEKDEDVAAVWKTILSKDYKWLEQQIMDFEISIENANRIINSNIETTKQRAFQTILRNRIQHGGILAQGTGLLKNGENGKGLKSRWYPATLKKRISDIQQIKDKLTFIEGDAFEIIERHCDNDDTVFFIDPPYTVAGRRLYKYFDIDHEKLFHQLAEVKGDFIITYDDAQEIVMLAKDYGFKIERVIMKTTHHIPKYELVIGKDLQWLYPN